MQGRGDKFLAGSAFALHEHRRVRFGELGDQFIQGEHLRVTPDDSGELLDLAQPMGKPHLASQIPEARDDANLATALIGQVMQRHGYATPFAAAGADIQLARLAILRQRMPLAERALPIAETARERLVAVTIDHLGPLVAGKTFGRRIEVENAALQVVRDHAFGNLVQHEVSIPLGMYESLKIPLVDQIIDEAPNLVAGRSESRQDRHGIARCLLRIDETPAHVAWISGQERKIFGCAVGQGHDQVEDGDWQGSDGLGRVGSNIGPDFGHDLDGQRIEARRLKTRAKDIDIGAVFGTGKPLGHLAQA